MTMVATTSQLALSAAIVWGAADFSGGMAVRRLRVYWVLAISHAFSLTCLVVSARLLHQPVPPRHDLAWGLLAGVAGGLALLTFYSALALGSMGETASISGLLTATLPVVFTLATVGAPTARQLLGFAIAAAAIWLISTQGENSADPVHAGHRRKKLGLAVISGVGFGIFLIALRQANGGGLLWPLAASRIPSITLAVAGGLLFSRGRFTAAAPANPPSGPKLQSPATANPLWTRGAALAILAGSCDTTGNVLFVAATRTGRLDVAAVLASLYPASTIVLAAFVLKERTSAVQALGMAAALISIALIS